MLEKAAYELSGPESHLSHPVCAGVLIDESDLSTVSGEYATVAYGYPEDIGSQVLQRCLATSDGLAVDIPGLLPHHGVYFLDKTGPLDGITELGSIDSAQWTHMDKEILSAGVPPAAVT